MVAFNTTEDSKQSGDQAPQHSSSLQTSLVPPIVSAIARVTSPSNAEIIRDLQINSTTLISDDFINAFESLWARISLSVEMAGSDSLSDMPHTAVTCIRERFQRFPTYEQFIERRATEFFEPSASRAAYEHVVNLASGNLGNPVEKIDRIVYAIRELAKHDQLTVAELSAFLSCYREVLDLTFEPSPQRESHKRLITGRITELQLLGRKVA